MNWQTVGAVRSTELVDARLQLHHAAQIVAAAGVTFVDPRPDDSHPNFGWLQSHGALVGHALPGDGSRVGLRVVDATLVIVDDSGSVSDELALGGKTLEDGFGWLASATARAAAARGTRGITRAAYEIPAHAVGAGGRFEVSPREAFGELARWFANGHEALTGSTQRSGTASEVRCWPHHFDLGWLEVVSTAPDGSLAQSIGVGLSPGDAGYAEPYWYVSPWPYPAEDALPELACGHWHTAGYTAAVLPGSDVTRGPSATQCERVRAFLDAAIDASRRALAG